MSIGEVNVIHAETNSQLDTTFETVIDTFDDISGWTSSDPINTVPTLHTTTHVEGTGCLQIDTNGDSDNDIVYKNYASMDLSNATSLVWEAKVDWDGSELEYSIHIEDSSGYSKKGPLQDLMADNVWETISVDLADFSENQAETTDESDIVKISIATKKDIKDNK